MPRLPGGWVSRWPYFLAASLALAVAAIVVTASAPRSVTLIDERRTMGGVASDWGFEASKGDTIRLSFRADHPVQVSLNGFDEGNPTSRNYFTWAQVIELDAVVTVTEQHDVWLVFIFQFGRASELVPITYELRVDRIGVPPLWAWSAMGMLLTSVLVCAAGATLAIRAWRMSRPRSNLFGGGLS